MVFAVAVRVAKTINFSYTITLSRDVQFMLALDSRFLVVVCVSQLNF